ncbi:hypothetical protein COO91_11109 (plasmid) [Nostoc flagelliforme CCNUN1]|uniref:Uncharacterized protein n=1 Tax=Nostoc flagelliforme CCNUN1 TaxID=2038116 RepID=A0A2K8TB24_9NOSO|nr:hypothetical protein COO91_11109 [Nostoc flagelliforme CCNUN1]
MGGKVTQSDRLTRSQNSKTTKVDQLSQMELQRPFHQSLIFNV